MMCAKASCTTRVQTFALIASPGLSSGQVQRMRGHGRRRAVSELVCSFVAPTLSADLFLLLTEASTYILSPD